jgi:glycosyltransferase involved in cell wall biosynthesis
MLTTVPMSLNFFTKQISELSKIYDVTLISSPVIELKNIAEREGVKSKGIKMKREISLQNDLISLFSLIYFFIKARPYIIHCNTPKASLIGLLAGFLTAIPKRLYYVHGLRYEGAKGRKKQILIFMEKISCFCATEIIAVSKGIQEIVQNELTTKQVKVLHNGSANGMFVEKFIEADYNVNAIKKELGIEPCDFVYCFLGRIVSDKGINELVNAFVEIYQQYPNTKLLLIGFFEEDIDPLLPNTYNLIKSHPGIIETGFQSDVKKYLSIIDILVSPSYREGFGLSILEANLMGKPVIVSKITGYSEIVNEGFNGFLVKVKSKDSLQNKMLYAYDNRIEIMSMGKRCIELVKEKYNHADVLAHAMSYYKNLQ